MRLNQNLLPKRYVLVLLALCLFSTSCSFQEYIARPIDQQAIVTKVNTKDPNSPAFIKFLSANGYADHQLPINLWGVEELTHCALFFHPSLDVARAQWHHAETQKALASEKPIPTLNANVGRSNNANNDISPYALGLSIDIPIETANKRKIHIEGAQHLSQLAKLEIAQTAWQLRSQIKAILNEYDFNQRQIQLLSKEQTLRQNIVAMYQKRVSVGEASNLELSTAKLQLQNTATELSKQQQSLLVLKSNLASNIGLPLAKLESMPLASPANTALKLANIYADQLPELQASALLNRIDIRMALERYAVAEAKLRLEIAKQYPDFSLSPGYAYEFGSHVWSLGLSGILTLLNKNKLAIAEATQLREIEAAQFETLQTTIIAEVATAQAKLSETTQAVAHQRNLYQQQQQQALRMQKMLEAGDINKLELTVSQLEDVAMEKSVLQADFRVKESANTLESVIQKPLNLENKMD